MTIHFESIQSQREKKQLAELVRKKTKAEFISRNRSNSEKKIFFSGSISSEPAMQNMNSLLGDFGDKFE